MKLKGTSKQVTRQREREKSGSVVLGLGVQGDRGRKHGRVAGPGC